MKNKSTLILACIALILFGSTLLKGQCEFVIDASKTEGCPGEPVNLEVQFTGGDCDGSLDYAWSNTENTQDIDVVFDPNNPTYSVTVTNGSMVTSTESITLTVFSNPSANITGTDSACENAANFPLSGNAAGGETPYAHVWSSSNTNLATVSTGAGNTSLNPKSDGIVTITYQVTDNNDCVATDDFDIEIWDNPSANISATATEQCQGFAVSFNGNPSGGNGGYSQHVWTSSDATIAAVNGNGTNATANSGVNDGTASITYSFEDSNGCAGGDSYSLTYNENPTAEITFNDGSCESGSFTICGNPMGGDGEYSNHSWSSSSISVATISGSGDCVTLNLLAQGMTTLTYEFEDGNDCMGMATYEYEFNGFPTAGITGNDKVCIGESLTLMGSVSGGTPFYNYEWSSSNKSVLTVSNGAINTVVTGINPGTATVTFRVFDSGSCTASEELTITVLAAPTADAGEDLSICLNTAITLGGEPTASGGSAPYSYDWENADDEATPVVTPQNLGDNIYTVEVTDDNGCSDEDEVVITAFDVPFVSILGPTSACSGKDVTLMAMTSNGPGTIEYIWLELDGNSWELVGENENKLEISSIAKTTDYRVRIRFMDSNGFSFTGCEIIESEVHTIAVVPNPAPEIASLVSEHCPDGVSLFYNSNARIGSKNTWQISGSATVQDTFLRDGILFVHWPNEPGNFTIKLTESIGDDCQEETTIQLTLSTGSAPAPEQIFLTPINYILVYNDSTACKYQWGYFDSAANNGLGQLVTDLPNNTFQSYKPEPYNPNRTYFCTAWSADCNSDCSTTSLFRNASLPPSTAIAQAKKFKLFPNPNLGDFTLEVNNLFPDAAHEIQIFNSLGKLMQSEQIYSQGDKIELLIDAKEKSAGVYYLILRFNGEVLQTEGFVIHPN